jgi:Transposase IS116/IS110/IS902 family/Transposase
VVEHTLFLGLDVHKKTISVATVEGTAGAEVRFYGTIENTPDALRKLGGTFVDPPRKAGERIKTDRWDAMMLAQTLRAGQLTEVWVPDQAHEAMRDLVRLRSQAMRDLRKTRQHLLSFLLRHERISPYGHWTKMHRRWLGELTFAHPAQHLAPEEMLQRIQRAEELCDRLKQAIGELAPQWSLAPVVQALQALRGVSLITAAVLVAEIGNFQRFDSPRQLMAYLGLNPSEHSSGATVRRGAITKTGNGLARTSLVEAAWTYRPDHSDHPQSYEGTAGADPYRGLEGTGSPIGALSLADSTWQVRAYRDCCHRPRAGGLHLGDRSHGRTKVRLRANAKRATGKRESREDTDFGARCGRQAGEVGNPRGAGLEQAFG